MANHKRDRHDPITSRDADTARAPRPAPESGAADDECQMCEGELEIEFEPEISADKLN